MALKMNQNIGKFFLYTIAFFCTLITVFPLAVAFLNSVRDNQAITLNMLSMPEVWLWENYTAAIQRAHMGTAVLNSLFIALATTVLVIFIAMPAAYVLSRKKFRLRKFLYVFFILGVMIPVHSTLVPIATLAVRMNGRNTYWFIILVYVALNLTQAIFLFTGYLSGIDRELDQAAKIDGCNDIQFLFRILFPVARPIIATVAVLTFVFAYGELVFSLILVSDTQMFTVARAMLTFTGAFQQQLGPIFASIIIAVIPMIVIYVVFHEKVQSGMLEGAIKS